MANYKVGDQVKDLAGEVWTITHVSFDPGERHTYYNVRKEEESGFVWESTLSSFVAKKLVETPTPIIHSCDLPGATEEGRLKEPCDACDLERTIAKTSDPFAYAIPAWNKPNPSVCYEWEKAGR